MAHPGKKGSGGATQESGGGGVGTPSEGASTIANTIIANNVATNSAYANCFRTDAAVGGNNIEFNPTMTCDGPFANGDPKLDIMRDNTGPALPMGGSLPTFALLTGSTAIGMGSAAFCAVAKPDGAGGIDERGVPRATSICSIGAYEAPAPAIAPVPPRRPGAAITGPTPAPLPPPLHPPAPIAPGIVNPQPQRR